MGDILAKYGIPVEILTDRLYDMSQWLDQRILVEYVRKFGATCDADWDTLLMLAIRDVNPEIGDELDRFPKDHRFDSDELRMLLAACIAVRALEVYAESALEVTLPEYQPEPPRLFKELQHV